MTAERILGAAVLATLLLSGCGGSTSRPAPEPSESTADGVLRLVELSSSAEVRWPALDGAKPPLDLKRAVIGDMPAPGSVVEVQMFRGVENRESRAALLAPTGSTYRFRLRLPAEPKLSLGLGYLLVPEEAPRRVTYRVTVGSLEAQRQVVLESQLETRTDGGWSDHEISLSPWAGEDVTLELEILPSSETAPVWAAWSTPEIAGSQPRAEGWDFILVSLDTLRADHLGCYGYQRPTSPHLDAFAAGSVRFETAVSQSPWTRPSHLALFTGFYPASNGGLKKPPPLAWRLWQAGYRTGAITGGGQVDRDFGFHRGFETYRVDYWVRDLDTVVDWLEAGRNRRNFLFLHTFEIHDPYTDTRFAQDLPRGRFQGQFSAEDWRQAKGTLTAEEKAYVEALYDGGIAFTDQQLGLLFEELDARGLLDRAIVVITSDHGEQFWEHGSWRHGSTMYDHQLLVPLILRLPPQLRRELAGKRRDLEAAGRVVEQQVQLVDIYPTVLELLGVELEHQLQGRSLRPLLEGKELPERRAFSENTNVNSFERKAFRTQRFKFIYSFPKKSNRTASDEYCELYDLSEDPQEQHNLAAGNTELVESLREEIRALWSGEDIESLQEKVPADISPELREQLKALGYVED
jgi:arylsulfatase A-like enzyme